MNIIKRGQFWRIVDSSGNIARGDKRQALDGGGCASQEVAEKLLKPKEDSKVVKKKVSKKADKE